MHCIVIHTSKWIHWKRVEQLHQCTYLHYTSLVDARLCHAVMHIQSGLAIALHVKSSMCPCNGWHVNQLVSSHNPSLLMSFSASLSSSFSLSFLSYFFLSPCSGDASSMQADNPLYGEYADEELRVDLFQPPSDDETEGMTLFSPPFTLTPSLSLSFSLFFRWYWWGKVAPCCHTWRGRWRWWWLSYTYIMNWSCDTHTHTHTLASIIISFRNLRIGIHVCMYITHYYNLSCICSSLLLIIIITNLIAKWKLLHKTNFSKKLSKISKTGTATLT